MFFVSSGNNLGTLQWKSVSRSGPSWKLQKHFYFLPGPHRAVKNKKKVFFSRPIKSPNNLCYSNKNQAIDEGDREVTNRLFCTFMFPRRDEERLLANIFGWEIIIKMHRTFWGGNPHVQLFSFLPPLFLRKVGVTVISPPTSLPFFLSVQPGK